MSPNQDKKMSELVAEYERRNGKYPDFSAIWRIASRLTKSSRARVKLVKKYEHGWPTQELPQRSDSPKIVALLRKIELWVSRCRRKFSLLFKCRR